MKTLPEKYFVNLKLYTESVDDTGASTWTIKKSVYEYDTKDEALATYFTQLGGQIGSGTYQMVSASLTDVFENQLEHRYWCEEIEEETPSA